MRQRIARRGIARRAHLRLVGIDQVELRRVRRVLEDGGDHLQHRRDAGAARHHPELLARVLLRAALELAVAEVRVRADRPGDVDLVARLEAAEVLRHLAAIGEDIDHLARVIGIWLFDDAALVHLDHKVDVADLVIRRRRRVLALNLWLTSRRILPAIPLALNLALRVGSIESKVLTDRKAKHGRLFWQVETETDDVV